MSKNSPSARLHRLLKYFAQEVQYRKYGPLIGPKEKHQPNPRWGK
jgi:hypothetical protein